MEGNSKAFKEWVAKNSQDWNLICGANDARPTDDDLTRLYRFLKEMAAGYREFDVAFLVFITRYGSRLAPGRIMND